MSTTMTLCPCCSELAYENCCAKFISGDDIPVAPEQLMRSRYTAFTQANVAYLIKTMKGKALAGFNSANTRQWAESVEWLGLEVIHAPSVTPEAKVGIVEFIASFREQGKVKQIHEQSEFQREAGRWYYISGNHKAGKQGKVSTKIGRNDLCPCNSRKKYKKCCGSNL
jgi:SEC-C motif domain protein